MAAALHELNGEIPPALAMPVGLTFAENDAGRVSIIAYRLAGGELAGVGVFALESTPAGRVLVVHLAKFGAGRWGTWKACQAIARATGAVAIKGVSDRPLDRLTGGGFRPVATVYVAEVS